MRLITGVKNPTEELTVHILFTLVVGYFAFAQYDVKSPIGALTRATSPVSSGESTPGRVEVFGIYAPYFITRGFPALFCC